MELLNYDELSAVLQDYAKDAEELYKYQISVGGKNASRELIDSVKTKVVAGNGEYEVTMTLAKYWKYVEGGSQGTESSPPGAKYPAHFPPPWAIEEWVNVKPILPHPLENGRLPSPKQLSYMIAHSIEKRGIEPFPAMATTMEELNKLYAQKITAALSRCITGYIEKVLSGD